MSDDEMSSRRSTLYSEMPSGEFNYDLLGKHMDIEYNTSALHRKLQSKVEAVRILRKELEQFRTERDQFKLMAETLQLRYSAIKRNTDLASCGLGGGKTNVATILHETRERNIKLTTEVEALKQKLNELQGDMELLRTKEHKTERIRTAEMDESILHLKENGQWKQERANFICHLENLKKKNAQLAFDFKAIIDEKEELITERDAYKCKAHRLNHELLIALKSNEAHPKFLDIDGIILENKYLHERLKSFENELDLTKQSMNKYKTMLEAKRKKGIIKLGTNNKEESILSHKQVKNLLESGIDLPTKTETIQDLKSLCLALLDNLNDKNLALSHQKKTNKILATKIAELEQRIQALTGDIESTAMITSSAASATDKAPNSASTTKASECTNSYHYAPSQLLLYGYCPSLVDTTTTTKSIITNDTHTKSSISSASSLHHTNDDSVTISSEVEASNKSLHVHNGPCGRQSNSDDGMSSSSSISTESARSVLSSEYGGMNCIDGISTLSKFANTAMNAYKTPSTTTDSGGGGGGTYVMGASNTNSHVPNSIIKERINDLKDLPPELAAMVQKALHELDMRDFDEVVSMSDTTNGVEDVNADVEISANHQSFAVDENNDDGNDDDDNTIN